ncbi:MAG: tRNA preQ1(34) S-adenosylmethionine ribosyltransferase-isomerase QueA [Gammaproteobacteria bacterium]
MKLSQFDYTLPEERIARYPTPNRRDSRLLVLDGPTGAIQDSYFKDLLALLRPNDCLVFNDTKVIPARIFGHKSTGGRVEILIERLRGTQEALCHVKGSKGLKDGAAIHFEGAVATVMGREGNCLKLAFNTPILPLLDKQGEIPLPPYFERKPEELDMNRYQTVYAANPGAVAAPTAGLHFDEAMLAALDAMGVTRAQVTLHVGAGTFQPVKTEDITEHEMHAEWAQVPPSACEVIARAKALGGRIIAVGTTSLRSLESASTQEGVFPFEGETRLFIYPGYRFNVIDALITNFHLPKSTLLMLVSAFAGYDHIRAAYQHAIEQEYNFFSYGDALFLTAQAPPLWGSSNLDNESITK